MPSELSVKQQREARRAEKVAALKKQQAAQKRNRLITLIGTVAASAGVLALVIGFVVTSSVPKVDPASIDIAGLTTFDKLTATHVADATPVDYEADYGMNPPAGGNHWGAWLNCGIYTEPQQNENAVHALEHGAVWVTYNPDELTADEITALQNSLPETYIVMSPYPGLQAPVVASAWGNQIELDGVDDPRLADFVTKFWRSADVPEPTAMCTGAIDGPGKIA
jgi:hypothetical protein